MPTPAEALNAATDQIIGAAIDVHRKLGPGLLESAYEACLYYELVTRRGLRVERQKALPLKYEDVQLDCAYRMDLVVENAVIVEVKAVSRIDRVHEAQMDSVPQNLRSAGWPVAELQREGLGGWWNQATCESVSGVKCFPRRSWRSLRLSVI